MNDAVKCLGCYQPLNENMGWYHSSCSKKIFGQKTAPALPYELSELNELAKKIIQRSITVPGVQSKLSLNLDSKSASTNRLTLVGLWGNFILKPPVEKYPQMPEIEDMTMHLASFFKIETVPHSLIRLKSGELAYITRRIDRDMQNRKYHMEDMCQLTERLTEDKYRGSMEQVAKTIERFSSNPLLDITRFFDMTVFSFLTGNADMHLKNFSLIEEKNMQRLTPAYDMLATRLIIPESTDPEELALTLNGKKSKFNFRDFKIFSETIGMNNKQFGNSLKRFKKGFSAALHFISTGFLTKQKKNEFLALMQERTTRLNLLEKEL